MKPILIFDYDGTLHETMHIYKPAVHDVVRWLRDVCHEEVEMPSDRRISSWLGMNTADMWKDFMPGLEESRKRTAGMRVGDGMLQRLRNHQAKWYDGVTDMLDRLKAEGYQMAVLSNCGVSYAQAHWDAFRMDRWFLAYFECESYGGIPKHEILRIISGDFPAALRKAPVKNQISTENLRLHFEQTDSLRNSKTENTLQREDYIMIGDRASDRLAGEAIDCPFIGCTYGYGSQEELEGSTAYANNPMQIAEDVMMLARSIDEPEKA